ncbi:MAG: PAS domain-containing sensor histidine kinase [Abitibacteriaceae bacterium]|nr:PAS domain-containing sensor histidine kinase [Abditibacteriaceae bacterium]
MEHRAANIKSDPTRQADAVQPVPASLPSQEDLYRSVFERSAVGTSILDLNCRFIKVNQADANLFGYTPEEMLQIPVGAITDPTDAGTTGDYIRRLFAGEIDSFQIEKRYRHKQGHPFWGLLSLALVRDAVGQPAYFIAQVQDITAHKELEAERAALLAKEREARTQAETAKEQAEAAREQAEAANRAKDEFLATLSHELRTPLNAILGWAHLLRSGQLDDANAATAVETIERNAQLQAQLVEDLLDVSRIISGKLHLKVQVVKLVPIIQAAITAVQPAAEAKAIQFRCDLDSTIGPITGDPARLQQVISNLLSNAIKFTPEQGDVYVLLKSLGSAIEIQVRDTGQGIKPEFLPHVFDRFRQADGSSTRNYGGLGLGLAIARHLTELHGGTVEVHSEGEGRGAVFTVQLPLAPTQTDSTDGKTAGATAINNTNGNAAGAQHSDTLSA